MSCGSNEIFDAEKSSRGENPPSGTVRTEGLWQKCDGLPGDHVKKDLETTMNVCGKCGLSLPHGRSCGWRCLFDDGIYEEFDEKMGVVRSARIRHQRAYKERLRATQELTSRGTR